jgi:hypothetical protein
MRVKVPEVLNVFLLLGYDCGCYITAKMSIKMKSNYSDVFFKTGV